MFCSVDTPANPSLNKSRVPLHAMTPEDENLPKFWGFYCADKDFQSLADIFEYAEGSLQAQGFREYVKFSSELRPRIAELHNKAWNVMYSYRILTESHSYGPVPLPQLWLQEAITTYGHGLKNYLATAKEKGPMFRVHLEGKPFLLFVETFLFEIKAALDLLAKIICKALRMPRTPMTFGKSGNDVGGEFLKILETKAPQESAAKAFQIRDTFKAHKVQWLDRAVNLRDTVTHYSGFNSELTLEISVTNTGAFCIPPLSELVAEYRGEKLFKILQESRDGFIALLRQVLEMCKETSQEPSSSGSEVN
jgi:hypothetical protein